MINVQRKENGEMQTMIIFVNGLIVTNIINILNKFNLSTSYQRSKVGDRMLKWFEEAYPMSHGTHLVNRESYLEYFKGQDNSFLADKLFFRHLKKWG